MVGRAQSVNTILQTSHYNVRSFCSSSSYYEGHSIQGVTFPMRLMKRLGVDTVIGKAARRSVSINIDGSFKSPMPLVA